MYIKRSHQVMQTRYAHHFIHSHDTLYSTEACYEACYCVMDTPGIRENYIYLYPHTNKKILFIYTHTFLFIYTHTIYIYIYVYHYTIWKSGTHFDRYIPAQDRD